MTRLYMGVIANIVLGEQPRNHRAIIATTEEGLRALADSYSMTLVYHDYYNSIEDMMEDEQEAIWMKQPIHNEVA